MLQEFISENINRGWELNSVIISRGEDIIEEYYRQGDILQPQFSITKAFTACAIGTLYDRGLLDTDDYITKYIDFNNITSSNPLNKVKIKHLLTNTMGTDHGYLFEADRHTYDTDDYLEIIQSKTLLYEPGEKFVYSNANFYLLSRIIENICGIKADDYIIEYILRPLDIDEYQFLRCPQGHFLGGSGMFLKTHDMIKLGTMLSQQGIYQGERILSKHYVEQAINACIKINSTEKYGYSFMMKDSRSAYIAGRNNQLLLIDKRTSTVIAINSYVNPSRCSTLMKLVRKSVINNL